ncbi:MAG: class I SAM-dependent methyltransferase [Pseudomonadota bacterium]|nr:class I SAM-dependent methyltransferase [Pseudomonadota bacterium]
MPTESVRFFDTQFQRQVNAGEFELNPFERLTLPYLGGELLDLGCGLGNLALEAARAGCRVTALDGSPTGIARLRETAAGLGLPVAAHEADLGHWLCDRDYDGIVAIGLLMFFPRERAEALLADIVAHVRPGGVVALNVLTEGTTFLGMFEPDHYHLFAPGALKAALPGWEVLAESVDQFPAPGDTRKVFETVIARKP